MEEMEYILGHLRRSNLQREEQSVEAKRAVSVK